MNIKNINIGDVVYLKDCSSKYAKDNPIRVNFKEVRSQHISSKEETGDFEIKSTFISENKSAWYDVNQVTKYIDVYV